MPLPSLLMGRDTVALRQHCEQRFAALELARQPWLDYCREVASELMPNRLPYLLDPHDTQARGGDQNRLIVDAVGHLAVSAVAAAIGQGTMPAASPWFDLGLRGRFGADEMVRGFLDDGADVMRTLHNQSNANHVLPEAHQEWVAFGTACALVVEDDVDDYRLDVMSVGEYLIADDHRGRVDTCYRSLTMTVGQLEQEFGLEALSMEMQAAWRRREYDTPVSVIHAIEPDRDRKNPLGEQAEMPWRSVYYERDGTISGVLAVRSYARFPVLCWRWGKLPGCAYGFGRGHECLPHLVRLRRLIYRYGQAVANMVDPAIQVPPGLQAHEVRMLPGQHTKVVGQTPITNLRDVRVSLKEMAEEIERAKQDIRDTIGSTLVASLRRIQRQMTAREADLRTSQDLTEFLPGLYRLHEELLSPYIEWLWEIAQSRGYLPDVPTELDDQVIDIEFTSPLARKQDEAEVDAMVETLAIAGELAKVRPDVIDNFDFDEAMRRVVRIKGAPAAMLFSRDQVQQLRAARAQQQQAEARAAAAQQGVDLAKTAAEADAA